MRLSMLVSVLSGGGFRAEGFLARWEVVRFCPWDGYIGEWAAHMRGLGRRVTEGLLEVQSMWKMADRDKQNPEQDHRLPGSLCAVQAERKCRSCRTITICTQRIGEIREGTAGYLVFFIHHPLLVFSDLSIFQTRERKIPANGWVWLTIGSLCCETPEEAKTLVPSLTDKITDEDLQELLDEIVKLMG